MTSAPELSVILVTDTYATVRKVIEHLRRQSARDRIEIVIVTPEPDRFDRQALRASALQSVVVESDLESLPRARARGVEAATAPVVVLGETHAYPDPEYAAALIEAHRGPWAVVGPAMHNANPESMLSWAALLLDYGPWVETTERGPMPDVPAHNGAYKRRLLLEYGSGLERALESDTVLNAELRAKGHELFLEPGARTYHLNVSRVGACIVERVTAGRTFAASRAQAWPPRRRLAYAVGAPLIPLIRLRRTLGYVRRCGRGPDLLPRLLPALGFALVFSAFGELLGYAFGAGDARSTVEEIELHRERYTRNGVA